MQTVLIVGAAIGVILTLIFVIPRMLRKVTGVDRIPDATREGWDTFDMENEIPERWKIKR